MPVPEDRGLRSKLVTTSSQCRNCIPLMAEEWIDPGDPAKSKWYRGVMKQEPEGFTVAPPNQNGSVLGDRKKSFRSQLAKLVDARSVADLYTTTRTNFR